MRALEGEDYGVKIGARQSNHLRFADNIADITQALDKKNECWPISKRLWENWHLTKSNENNDYMERMGFECLNHMQRNKHLQMIQARLFRS